MNIRNVIQLFAVFIFLGVACPSQQAYQGAQDPQPSSAQPGRAPDLIEQLRLTPEQRQKIRAIREQSKDMRAAINQRLRDANLALEQALDGDNLDEALIEQRLKEAATAQVASTRMRIQTEVAIRRVLNPEQISTLRSLRLQARGLLREANQNQRPNRQEGDRIRPNQRNGVAPLYQRPNVTRPSGRP